jgi:hypothetical protein
LAIPVGPRFETIRLAGTVAPVTGKKSVLRKLTSDWPLVRLSAPPASPAVSITSCPPVGLLSSTIYCAPEAAAPAMLPGSSAVPAPVAPART